MCCPLNPHVCWFSYFPLHVRVALCKHDFLRDPCTESWTSWAQMKAENLRNPNWRYKPLNVNGRFFRHPVYIWASHKNLRSFYLLILVEDDTSFVSDYCLENWEFYTARLVSCWSQSIYGQLQFQYSYILFTDTRHKFSDSVNYLCRPFSDLDIESASAWPPVSPPGSWGMCRACPRASWAPPGQVL